MTEKACRLFCASLFKEKVLHGNGLILKFWFVVILRIFDTIEFFPFTHAIIANMLLVSKNCSLEKVAFMNSSCFMICVLDSFMAIVKHFLVIQGKCSSGKGLNLKYMVIQLTRLSFLSSRTQ